MAKFFPGTGNSYFLEDIIVSAKQSILLVSPCLKLADPLVQKLKDANLEGKKITLIFEKYELTESQLDTIRNLPHAEFYSCINLSKEYYANENVLVVSSNNTAEHAAWNGKAMWVLLDREQDSELFLNTISEIGSVKSVSKKENTFAESLPSNQELPVGWGKQNLTTENLHIPLIKPYIWKNYPDVEYFECISGTIELHNFPKETLSVWINGRIDINFDFEKEYSTIESAREHFEERLPARARVEWNTKKISIYKPDDFHMELTKESQVKAAEFFIQILQEVVRFF